MSSEYQPKFNRMSLNVLMLASAALIVNYVTKQVVHLTIHNPEGPNCWQSY